MESTDAVESALADFFGNKVAAKRIVSYLARNETYLIDAADAILKLFHHAAEVKCEREYSAYQFLCRHNLPVAKCLGRGRVSKGDPWLLVERLPGMGWEEVSNQLNEEQTEGLWQELGTLLASLHDLPIRASHGTLGYESAQRSTVVAFSRY